MALKKIADFPEFETRSSLTLIMGLKPLSKKDFLALLAKKLRFPPYFGMNWDAAAECLAGLASLKKRNIRLIFPVKPLKSPREMKTLETILAAAQEELRKYGTTLETDLIAQD